MRKAVYILFLISWFTSSFSQVADTVFVGQTKTYKVQNQQNTSWLHWDISQGEILSENPTQSDSIVVQWHTEGFQTLSIYETTVNQCVGEIQYLEIVVKAATINADYFIPNAFSPNGNGKNETFGITFSEPPEMFLMRIFNRWGNEIFRTNDYTHRWDGTYRTGSLPDGTYYYVAEFRYNAQNHTLRGFVHLAR